MLSAAVLQQPVNVGAEFCRIVGPVVVHFPRWTGQGVAVIGAPFSNSIVGFTKALVWPDVDCGSHSASGRGGADDPIVPNKGFADFNAALDIHFAVEINCQVSTGVRDVCGSNKRPDFSAGLRNQLRKFRLSCSETNDGCYLRRYVLDLNLAFHYFLTREIGVRPAVVHIMEGLLEELSFVAPDINPEVEQLNIASSSIYF
jgi:hypothetical protein